MDKSHLITNPQFQKEFNSIKDKYVGGLIHRIDFMDRLDALVESYDALADSWDYWNESPMT